MRVLDPDGVIVGTRFILVWADRPYLQSSVARAIGTLLLIAHSRGYKEEREGTISSLYAILVLKVYVLGICYNAKSSSVVSLLSLDADPPLL